MARSLLSLPEVGGERAGDRGFPTIEVPAIAQVGVLADRAEVLGGAIIKRPFATYYGQWQVVLRDPEANLLRIACLDLPLGTSAPTMDF